jgi:hypothetical protein
MNLLRKRALTVALLSLLGIATAGSSLFVEPALAAEAVQGVVMNAGNSQLMITPDSGDMVVLAVAPNARIMRDGQVTQLEELQARDHVSVMCTGNGQDRVATDIMARSPL